MGFGLLAKYTMALLGVAALVFILTTKRSRKWLSRPESYLAFVLGFLLFLPVVIWNAEHAWASFYLQGPVRLHRTFHFALPELIGTVLALLTPVGGAAVMVTMTSGRRLLSESDGCRGGATRSARKPGPTKHASVPRRSRIRCTAAWGSPANTICISIPVA